MVSTHSQKPDLSITQALNKIKKPECTFVDSDKQERCAKFQQKILNSMLVGARQNFPEKKVRYLGGDRALSKFKW